MHKIKLNSKGTISMRQISKFSEMDRYQTHHLLFLFKSNRLTDRGGTIPNYVFRVLRRPYEDIPTVYDISKVYEYKYACQCGNFLYLTPFPTIWKDNTTFGEFSRRMTARRNKYRYEFSLSKNK